jgi:hypothetical protein
MYQLLLCGGLSTENSSEHHTRHRENLKSHVVNPVYSENHMKPINTLWAKTKLLIAKASSGALRETYKGLCNAQALNYSPLPIHSGSENERM